MLSKIINLLLIIWPACFHIITADKQTAIVCQNDVFSANCPAGHVIAFETANYGRSNSSVCGADDNVFCRLKETLGLLNRKCFGKGSCELKVDNSLFGIDPCAGSAKYLETSFNCVPEETVHEACKKYMVVLGDNPSSGYIKSTNYPEKYKQNHDCVIRLKVKAGYKYDISLLDLDVENREGAGCYDWLIIQDEENAARHFSYCGRYGDIHTAEPERLEQMDNVVITFTSDSMTSRSGFVIKYQEVPATLQHREL